MEDVTAVTVKAIDRDNGWIVLDPNQRWPTMLDDLEIHSLANLSTNVILDPVHHDYFTNKLVRALQAIGNPPNARRDPLVERATGQMRARGARQTAHTPPADLLWDALTMYNTLVTRNLVPVQTVLQQHGLDLNASQWRAWQEALSRRLQLIWGPPGTGKSRTIRAVALGAALEAHQQGRPIRILICSATYRAMDNVLLPVYNQVQHLIPSPLCETYRLRSYLQSVDPVVPTQIDVELNRSQPSTTVRMLINRLGGNNITIIGATPEQVHNLLRVINDQHTQQELFDLLIIDEASQMDVAHAVLPLCALASGGSVILAGDPKQLPPIHQAQPPLGLEDMVGSIYNFCREFHQVPEEMLMINYRSNSTIVDFSLNAGYRPGLSSYSTNLRLNPLASLPTNQPANWPAVLYWTPDWSEFLNPDHPTVCFVYQEGHSSQWNQFEADAIAALAFTLYDRLANQLLNEHDLQGNIIPATNTVYTPAEFWGRAVGIVTPHRAQQGLIISRLQQVFAYTGIQAAIIRDAVDTVERFQGQQRDVIIASFALGDPDAIRDEDEFLMSLNRFNVMASRARAKLIVLVSQEVVDHLSSDIDILRESSLLKIYVESFCRNSRDMSLGFIENGNPQLRRGLFKYR